MPGWIATHEAGHAVVCAALGGSVSRVVALPDNGYCLGKVPYAAPLAQHVAYYVAGAVAESLLMGRINAEPSADDLDGIAAALRGGSRAEKDQATRTGWGLARMLIKRHERTTTALAKALDDKTILQGAELQELLKPAQYRAPSNER